MLDRATFLRATAHRGLHDASKGIIENTRAAFEAAIAAEHGIECDLQRSKDHVPLVFHDFDLERLTNRTGALADLSYDDINEVRYKDSTETIMTFAALLEQVANRVPLLVELKSDWSPPDVDWLTNVCRQAANYTGPVALMSFDPAVVQVVKHQAPHVPRGLVSGNFRNPNGTAWWPNEINDARATELSNLKAVDDIKPDFIAYHVKDLDTAAVKRSRDTLNLPIYTWTVRTKDDWRMCHAFADAAIFEGDVEL